MEKTYYPTIGLEIHAELSTQSKMFCPCVNDPDAPSPNIHVCPVCMALPGALPVPNKEAIRQVIRVGLAMNGTIADFTEFDRKNYFYPDIPKGYQISQYKYPIVSGGSLLGFDLTRIHLEEDTGTSKHVGKKSLVDFNRAGVPLMELVTEPVLHSAEDAVSFAKELQILLRFLGASHANMEKGEMRVEANISVSDSPDTLGTKVEVKNLNSFTAVSRAIEYEIARMTKLLEEGKGGDIVQETRGWDADRQKTFSQRSKENSEDYRYFPEPDIPKLHLHSMFDLRELEDTLPELPHEKRARYTALGIKDEDIEVYITDSELGSLFENVIISHSNDSGFIVLVSNYITSDTVGLIRDTEGPGRSHILNMIEPRDLTKLLDMNREGILNSRATKDILAILAREGGDPEVIANEQGLIQKSDPQELENLAQQIIDANPDQAEQYRSGKETLIKYFVGQGMKETKGSANPTVLEEVFVKLLE